MSRTPFEQLVKQFAVLPGLGPRSAKRIALHLLTKGPEAIKQFADTLAQTASEMKICSTCGNLDIINPCTICQDTTREQSTLCVVASIADVWAIERTSVYRGYYHVLGGVLSALDGISPDDLSFDCLETRLQHPDTQEVILALSATIDGQSTAHYINDLVRRRHPSIKITRLAHGMPMGGELDYMDDGTIMTALKLRAAVI